MDVNIVYSCIYCNKKINTKRVKYAQYCDTCWDNGTMFKELQIKYV